MQLVIMTSSNPMASVIVENMKKLGYVRGGGGGARGVLFVLIL